MAEIYNFFGDIWDYLRETYFEVDFGSYRNFSLDGFGATLSQIVFAVMIGCILASAVAVYERRYLGGFVRALIARGAQDEQNALTMADLGYTKGFMLKNTLSRRDSGLRRVLRFVGEEREDVIPEELGGSAKDKLVMRDEIDPQKTRFYVPAELLPRAQTRYDAKGSGIGSFLLIVVVCLVGGAVVLRLLPVFFRLIDNTITWIG
ncbi:MAG: hypothetical protein IJ009_03355 [Clostridia bacterium]|nr:hypothetical protein [Clostridia bacterium]